MEFATSAPANFTWRFSPDGSDAGDVVRETSAATSDKLPIDAEGRYELTVGSETHVIWWLSPVVDSVSFVVDSANCEALFVNASAHARPIEIGGATLEQKLTYEWEVEDSVIHTSVHPDAELDGVYDEGPLTLRVFNQAYNEIVYTDTVFPVAVKAAFKLENRKVDAPNEAVVSGEALSSPAEVAFTNESKGRYTVSEWSIGDIARLYDQSPVYQFQLPGTFRITLIVSNEEYGCQSADSSLTVTISEAAIEFPNAFTPNGDGANDIFCPAFRSLKSYELTIYNRWGHRVFESKDPAEGWDGKVHGKEVSAGTYYYICTAEGYERGAKFRRRGSVTLLR